MNRAILIDEHDKESIYRLETDQGYKYLFKLYLVTSEKYEVYYFFKERWNLLVIRNTKNKQYVVNLAVKLLESLNTK